MQGPWKPADLCRYHENRTGGLIDYFSNGIVAEYLPHPAAFMRTHDNYVTFLLFSRFKDFSVRLAFFDPCLDQYAFISSYGVDFGKIKKAPGKGAFGDGFCFCRL